ncbi:MAG: hypothetical protein HWN65_24390 [Candidatus Helarchaeota archaeon]|nr:hypothetical protein [Candidatus Helarchaeota archaeon]
MVSRNLAENRLHPNQTGVTGVPRCCKVLRLCVLRRIGDDRNGLLGVNMVLCETMFPLARRPRDDDRTGSGVWQPQEPDRNGRGIGGVCSSGGRRGHRRA